MGKVLLALALVVELLFNLITALSTTAKMFSWWKTKMYSHIIGMDEELWDILEEGVDNLRLDEEGVALDRKAHTTEQKKLYKKHHTIRGILVVALPHKEYLKMSDKSTAKAMFTSLGSLYEGNKKVREAKATMLVHQYELFRMKEDESIETMCHTPIFDLRCLTRAV